MGLTGCESPRMEGGFWDKFKMEAEGTEEEKAPWRAAWQDVTPGTGTVSLTGGCCFPRAWGHTLPPLSPLHHQGTAKVLKIPPRCLNSSWEHRRRRAGRGGPPQPALGRDLPRWGGHSIQLSGNPGLRTGLSHRLSPRTAPSETGGDPTSRDTPGIPCSAHNKHYK